MTIVSIGGGPAGLYFGILMKKADPARDIVVYERNRPDDTFGFGVVFSDATLGNLAAADPDTYAHITRHFAHWDDIDVHVRGQVFRSTGHGFCGLERKVLLQILTGRARELGVDLRFETEIDDVAAVAAGADLVLAADGVTSAIRDRYADHFQPEVDLRPNRFVWLGTTFPFEAFTFYFKENQHGLWRVHAYRYQEVGSTFIVECTEDTWRRSGMDTASEDDTIAYLQEVFAEELAGHPLTKNRSIWRSFPTVRNARWSHDNIVLVGDAAHTAHFSIGSGTKLAMEDCIDLVAALRETPDIPTALARYEAVRRPAVEKLQQAAQVSLEWFENTEQYLGMEPVQFAFSLLTRSLRVTHDSLTRRDPALVAEVDRWFAGTDPDTDGDPPPPMLVPLALRELVLPNRVVLESLPQEMAEDGTPGDWHLVHFGARAVGGAGLLMTEPTAVAAEGRAGPGTAGLYRADHQAAWQRIVHFVGENTLSAAGVRLTHAGRRAFGTERCAPSALPYGDREVPVALDRAGMTRITDAFVAAARMAVDAGFHLLELELGGGDLLHQFLSPLSNLRDDDHGGSREARMRFPLEVVEAVRRAWPGERPLSVHLAASDRLADGWSLEDAVVLARALAERGCDLLSVGSGGISPEAPPPRGRLVNASACDRIRNEAGVLTMCEGGVESHADIDSLLAAGRADLACVGRAFVYDPHFVRRAAHNEGRPLPWPLPYASAEDFEPRE